MAYKEKIGRLASMAERARAQQLLDMYQPAMSSPDGRYCLNPDDEPEIQSCIYADQVAGDLMLALERFVKNGTFAHVDFDVYKFGIREEYRVLRNKKDPDTRGGAIIKLSKKHNCDLRTIERIIKNTPVNDKL